MYKRISIVFLLSCTSILYTNEKVRKMSEAIFFFSCIIHVLMSFQNWSIDNRSEIACWNDPSIASYSECYNKYSIRFNKPNDSNCYKVMFKWLTSCCKGDREVWIDTSSKAISIKQNDWEAQLKLAVFFYKILQHICSNI